MDEINHLLTIPVVALSFFISVALTSPLTTYLFSVYQSTNPPAWGYATVAIVIFGSSFIGLMNFIGRLFGGTDGRGYK